MNKLQSVSAKRLQTKIDSGHYKTVATERCLCGGTSFRVLGTCDRIGLHVTSKLCEWCGLIHTDPKLAEQSMAEFYDQDYYPVYFHTHDGPTGGTWLGDTNFFQFQGHIIYNYCKKYLDNDRMTVLEIGCGNGRNLSQFRKQAAQDGIDIHPVGIEYSSEHRKAAKQTYGINDTFDSVEAQGKRQFDLLVLSHVLEHFSDIEHWIPQLAALLRDRGLLYVEVPGVLNLAENMVHKLNFKQYICLPHSFCYTLKTLAYVLSHFGFSLVEGDEFVRSVFRKDAGSIPLSPPTDVPTAVIEMMALLETPHYALTSQALMAGLNGDHEQGIALGREALAAQPEFTYAHAALASLHAQARQHEEAAIHAGLVVDKEIANPSPTILLLGRELEILGRLKEAEDVYEKHLALYPWDLRGKTGLARVSNQREDHSAALLATRALEDRWLYEPQAVLEEGRALKGSGALYEASEILERLHQAYPNAPEPLFELADIAHKQGRNNTAEVDYEKGLEIRPTFSWGWYCLSEIRRSLGKPESALEAVGKCLDLQQDLIQARILQAGLLAQIGKHEKSIAEFRTIHADYPDRADLLLNIADVCRYRGDYEQARTALNQYEREHGDSAQLAEAQAKGHAAMITMRRITTGRS
jgi:tetratricopeptide (TPR) repeat protein